MVFFERLQGFDLSSGLRVKGSARVWGCPLDFESLDGMGMLMPRPPDDDSTLNPKPQTLNKNLYIS